MDAMATIRMREGEEITVTKARDMLMKLPEALAESNEAIPLTRRGKPVMALMAWELFETIQETLEILSDEELMAALRRSIRQAEAGETIPFDEVMAGLDNENETT